jgi:hypothetical protein
MQFPRTPEPKPPIWLASIGYGLLVFGAIIWTRFMLMLAYNWVVHRG